MKHFILIVCAFCFSVSLISSAESIVTKKHVVQTDQSAIHYDAVQADQHASVTLSPALTTSGYQYVITNEPTKVIKSSVSRTTLYNCERKLPVMITKNLTKIKGKPKRC